LLIADPGVPAVIAERLSDSLPNALTDWAPADGKWEVSVRRDSYPFDEHAEVVEVIRAIDPAGETEDIVIYLTDLARRLGTTPVIADISLHNRFGLISIPGVGGLFIDRRVRNLAQTVVAEVTCQSEEQNRSVKRLTRTQEGDVVRYVAPTLLSRLQLLSGATTILASAAMIAWLILDHKLWERPPSAGERERAALYNAATVVTLTIGVAILHIGLFILLLVTAWWTLPPQMVADNIGHPVGLSTLLMMAWLVAAVATLAGALGSGLEDDDAVKAAAYGVRQRQRFDKSN
jgi:hypothetical protein